MFSIDVSVAPTWEPVTLNEAKLYARIDTIAEDALITALIVAGRERCEVECQRTIPQTTLVLNVPCFPSHSRGFSLPLPKVQSVSSVKYYDGNNTLQTITDSNYIVRAADKEGIVTPTSGYTWPASIYDRPDAVQVTYVAGYASADDVPESIKLWIKSYVATHGDVRHLVTVGTIIAVNTFVDRILDPHRLVEA